MYRYEYIYIYIYTCIHIHILYENHVYIYTSHITFWPHEWIFLRYLITHYVFNYGLVCTQYVSFETDGSLSIGSRASECMAVAP